MTASRSPMERSGVRRRMALVGLVIADLTVFICASLLDPNLEVLAAVLFVGLIASFGGIGALLTDRVSTNPIGPMLLVVGSLPALLAVAGTYARVGAAAIPQWPGATLAQSVANVLFIYPVVIALIGIPLVFPDGHLPSRRFRWVVWLTVAAMAATTVTEIFGPGDPETGVENPLYLGDLAPALDALSGFSSLTSVIGFGGAAAAVWVRFRGDDRVVRQQTKWLLAVAGVAAIAFPASFIIPERAVADAMFFIGFLAMLGLPVAIGVAILRYHLYEIDRIVSRTIAYVIITAILVGAYASIVIVIGGPLGDATGGETISVALSTLVVAALFQPVRRRIQTVVDRRFDRARIDAERTTAAFTDRLRDEVDIATVTRDLHETVSAAVRPVHLGVWLREADR